MTGSTPAARPLRVILADDSVLIREGLTRLLQERGFQVVAQTPNAQGLLTLARTLNPDILIVDVRMPPTYTLEGLKAAVAVRGSLPKMPVLVLSQHVETRYALELLGHNARGVGYLLKDRVTSINGFLDALTRVARGGTAIDEHVISAMMNRSSRDGGLTALTPREHEILALMAEGLTNPGIGRRLHLSPRTIESHVGSIFTKLRLLPLADDERRVLAVITHLRRDPQQAPNAEP